VPSAAARARLNRQSRAALTAEFRSFLAAECAKYAKLIADNGIKSEQRHCTSIGGL